MEEELTWWLTGRSGDGRPTHSEGWFSKERSSAGRNRMSSNRYFSSNGDRKSFLPLQSERTVLLRFLGPETKPPPRLGTSALHAGCAVPPTSSVVSAGVYTRPAPQLTDGARRARGVG